MKKEEALQKQVKMYYFVGILSIFIIMVVGIGYGF